MLGVSLASWMLSKTDLLSLELAVQFASGILAPASRRVALIPSSDKPAVVLGRLQSRHTCVAC